MSEMPQPSIHGTLIYSRGAGRRTGNARRELVTAAKERGLDTVCLEDAAVVRRVVERGISSGQRTFVAAGGDGTVSAVAASLVGTEAVLGIVPFGTFNHFARDLGVPLAWRPALDVALRGDIRQVDAGRVNDRYFVNNISLGFYPELVEKREERGRGEPRWRAVIRAVTSTFRSMRHVAIAIESTQKFESIRTHLFLVSNNSYDLSRLGIDAPRSSLDEGRLSVYWLPHLAKGAMVGVVFNYLRGRLGPELRSMRTSELRVSSSHAYLRIGIDGEVERLRTPLVIRAVPKALLVRVPRG
jgi:diacylglycerol kinase family enzyme